MAFLKTNGDDDDNNDGKCFVLLIVVYTARPRLELARFLSRHLKALASIS
jgi:hypothetical protein